MQNVLCIQKNGLTRHSQIYKFSHKKKVKRCPNFFSFYLSFLLNSLFIFPFLGHTVVSFYRIRTTLYNMNEFTVCPKSSDLLYIVRYYIKRVTTSWAYSTTWMNLHGTTTGRNRVTDSLRILVKARIHIHYVYNPNCMEGGEGGLNCTMRPSKNLRKVPL